MSEKKINFSDLVNFQAQLPDSVKLRVGKSQDGGYWVEVLNLPGCFTQVESGEELFVMVNDAVYTYLDIPEEYIRDMPRYFPSEKIRRKLQTWKKCIPADFLQQPLVFFPQGIAFHSQPTL